MSIQLKCCNAVLGYEKSVVSENINFTVSSGDYSYPEDYPDADTEIIISGVCDIYKEGTATYMQLLHAKYEVNE